MTDPTHEEFVLQREGFALRALDAVETEAFRLHLAGCADCTQAVAELERTLGWLGMGAAPIAPRPGLTDAIMRDLTGPAPAATSSSPARRERDASVAASSWPSSRARRVVPALIAAGVVLFVAFGWQRAESRALALREALAAQERLVAERDRVLAALRDTLAVVQQASRVAHAAVHMHDEPAGTVTILDDAASRRWYVVVAGLPPAPPGERYTFWFVLPDGMVRGADVTPGPDGSLRLTLDVPTGARVVLGAALTMEDEGNVSGPPRGMEIAHLTLDD